MTAKGESMADRRRRLVEQVHRQRMELGHAFNGLAKPIQYTQTAIVGFKALRENAWLVALTPAVIKLGFSLFGWKKAEQHGWLARFHKSDAHAEEKEAKRAAARAKKPIARLLGHGWSLFKIYRKVRPFFP